MANGRRASTAGSPTTSPVSGLTLAGKLSGPISPAMVGTAVGGSVAVGTGVRLDGGVGVGVGVDVIVGGGTAVAVAVAVGAAVKVGMVDGVGLETAVLAPPQAANSQRIPKTGNRRKMSQIFDIKIYKRGEFSSRIARGR